MDIHLYVLEEVKGNCGKKKTQNITLWMKFTAYSQQTKDLPFCPMAISETVDEI